MSTTFLLLRHGQTVANRTGYFQGWHDSPLDENGIAQVNCAAEYLKDVHFDAFYSSDLGRAIQTSKIVLKYHPDMELQIDPALREWHLGIYDGAYQPDVVREHPEFIRIFIRENETSDVPGGESRMEFQNRINKFFSEKAKLHDGQTVLICTHGGTLQRIFRMVSGAIADNIRLPLPQNASLSTIRFLTDINVWQLVDWNVRHYMNNLPNVVSLAL